MHEHARVYARAVPGDQFETRIPAVYTVFTLPVERAATNQRSNTSGKIAFGALLHRLKCNANLVALTAR